MQLSLVVWGPFQEMEMLTLLFKTPLIFAFIFLVISGRYGGKKERKK
jgi:hypothetical protein